MLCLTIIGFVQCYSLSSFYLHALLCFVQFSDVFVNVALPRAFRALAALFLWLGVIATRLFSWFVLFSNMFSLFCVWFLHLCSCNLYYYLGLMLLCTSVASFLLLPRQPAMVSNALIGLLTFRLPSLGWVSSAPFCFSLIVCLYPTQRLATFGYFVHTLFPYNCIVLCPKF